MANRRSQPGGGRRMDFGRNDRNKNFGGRSGVSPWQGGGGPGGGLPNLLPLGGGSTEATLALASNLINLLQPRQNPVPSLLDMPLGRDFGPNMGRFDRGYVPNRMGNQGNFRRTGNYNRAGERINTNRKPFRPNDGHRQQYKSTPKKEADSKAKPVKESEQEEKKEQENPDQAEKKDEESKKDGPKTRYDDINTDLLKCHICNKSMWDGRSFENHLSGRAHAIMMQKTAESYALTADTMRQEFKIREMKRTRKTGQHPARDFYCAMCDMYAGDGAVHRTNVCHRKLKKYLHPTCTSCRMEMPNRIELDEHRLTPEHLRNLQDKQGPVSKPKPEVMVISTLSMEQSYLRNDRHNWRHGDHTDDRKNGPKDASIKIEAEGEAKEGEEANACAQQVKEENVDNENTILDYKEGDDLTNINRDMYPAYSTKRGVGSSFLADFNCVQCQLCHKLLDTQETAEVHLRTWRHHQLFLRLLADRSQEKQEEQQEETETATTVKRSATDGDEDGNWKRRKTGDRSEEAEDGNEETEDGNGEIGDGNGEVEENGHEEQAIKEEPEDDKPTGNAANMPPADELEDWGDQTVDEPIEEENTTANEENGTAEVTPKAEPVAELQPEPVAKKPVPVAVAPVAASTPRVDNRGRGGPRGRARGRGRGRGRY